MSSPSSPLTYGPTPMSDNPLVRIVQTVFRLLDSQRPTALLLIRLYFGWQSMVSGHAHLTHVDQTADYFRTLGIPAPRLNVYMSAGTELVCGLLLLIGLGTRFAAVALAGNFLVAILAANPDARHVLKDSGPFVSDTAFPFFFASALFIFFGAGKWSVDHLICRKLFPHAKMATRADEVSPESCQPPVK